jgi:glutamine amidotransferase
MGICLGGQILLERGFENKLTPGVGIFSGQVVKSSDRLNSLNSHNGWDSVHVTRSFLNLDSGTSFDAYFNHNYIFDDTETTDVCAVSEFGGTFPVILEKNGTLAIQFHPEKSQSFGLKIIDEFLKTAYV